MAENTFDTEEVNLQIQPLPGYIDADGAFKLNTPLLSSFNFDGSIPKFDGQINAGDVEPGYLIQIESGGQYFPVVSIEKEEADLEDSPSGIISIGYINAQGSTVATEYEETDQVSVVYEDWDNKVLGAQGWGITAGGNAIFTNVAVRGDLEATTLDVGGSTGITFDGNTVTLGASVVINAPVTFNGSGSFVTFNDLSASYALQSYVDDLNDEISASLQDLFITTDTLSASIDFLYDAGFVTDTDLVTNGATIINGNNITTGTIDANQVNISSGLTGLRGIKVNSLGLTAYNSSGTQTFNINSNTGVVTIGAVTADQLATDSELSSGLGGKINNGGAATDVNSNVTTISGGKIRTGSIESTTYSYTSGLYSTNGMQINLDTTGYIRSPNFYLDPSGNAYFRGTVNAYSGFFGSESTNWSIGTETAAGYTSAFMKSGTLKLYTTTTGTPPVQHGVITLDNGSGLSAGSLSNALSVPANKTINALGNGLHIGTTTDYFFVPGTGNSLSPRIRSNGFEFRNTDENIAFKVGNNEISIPAATTINFWNDSQSPAAFLDYGPTNNQLVIGVGAGPGGSTFNGIVNFRASDIRLNGDSILGSAGAGVTTFKFGDNGLTETGAVAITGAEIITAINANSIGNGKLANSTIQIMSTTKSLGQSFVAGDIDGDVLTANSVPPGKISNSSNLFSIGGTGVARGNAITSISGPLTIGNLTVSSIPTGGAAQALDYAFYLGFSPINLNRSPGNAFLSGVVASANNLTVLTGLSSTLTSNGLLYNASGLLGALGNGTSGQFLRSGGTSAPVWETVNFTTNPMTTAGDLIFGTTNATPSTPGRIPIGGAGAILKATTSLGVTVPSWLAKGSTAGQFLRVNSGNTDIGWETVSFLSNPMTTVGDIIYGGTSGTPTRIAVGGTGAILRVSGGIPSWIGLPTTGAAGRVLTINSNGTDIEWASPPSGTLPSQTGNTGRYLRTDGTNVSWQYPVTSISVPAAFTSTFDSANGTNTIGYTTSGGGDRNVLRSISNGAVAMGKINGGHMNYTGPNTTYNPFMRMNSSTGDINLTNLNNSASSIRYKKIVNEPINLDSSWLDQINLIKFKYNLDIQSMGEEKAPVIIGLLAEELSENEVLNQLVSYDTENLPAAVDYEKISLLLIPIIKELRDKVAGLEARLDAAGL